MISDEVRLQVEELTQNGRMLLAAQKPEEAAKVIARAQELDPTYAESYNAMGAVLMKQKQYRQAKEQFKKALLILPLINIPEPTRRRGIPYAAFCLKKKKIMSRRTSHESKYTISGETRSI